jgi:hypothetical protein
VSVDDEQPDRQRPHDRPADPAGTRPKVDPESLVPATRDPLVAPAIDSTAVDEDARPDAAVEGEPHELLPERIAAASAPAPGGRRDDHAPHAPRFQFLFGALVTLGIAALATVVVIAARGPQDSLSGPAWSQWHPEDNGTSATEQIAQHVGREYRLSTGDQLVLVTGGPLEVAGTQLTIAVRKPADQGGDISLVDGKGVLYRLCGLGPKCSINKGKPSAARKLLLHREALELALYTFRYTDADHVVAVMPPGRPKNQPKKILDPDEALFFRRDDVGAELARPVTSTLTRTTPLPDTFDRSPDTPEVERLTDPRIFQFSLSPGNLENRAYLVLQRFSNQAQ